MLDDVFNVFSSVGNWIVDTVPSMLEMFYNPTDGLTLLGVLAVAGLGFSVVFLLIGLIQNFLHFRG